MTTRDHQAVALAHRVGVGDAERQLVLQQHPAAALQRAVHTARFAMAVAGLRTAKVGAVGVALIPCPVLTLASDFDVYRRFRRQPFCRIPLG